jgi:hypothetical protein
MSVQISVDRRGTQSLGTGGSQSTYSTASSYIRPGSQPHRLSDSELPCYFKYVGTCSDVFGHWKTWIDHIMQEHIGNRPGLMSYNPQIFCNICEKRHDNWYSAFLDVLVHMYDPCWNPRNQDLVTLHQNLLKALVDTEFITHNEKKMAMIQIKGSSEQRIPTSLNIEIMHTVRNAGGADLDTMNGNQHPIFETESTNTITRRSQKYYS